jgi:hypothetical protein
MGVKDGVEEEQSSTADDQNRLPWIISSDALLGIVLLLLKALKARPTS